MPANLHLCCLAVFLPVALDRRNYKHCTATPQGVATNSEGGRNQCYRELFKILWRVDPLRGSDCETNRFTWQRVHATTEELLKMMFPTRSVPRGYQYDKFILSFSKAMSETENIRGLNLA
jgi:hypothetical protein